jgi:hypothetical protein
MSEKIIQKKGKDISQDEWDSIFKPKVNVDADDEKVIAVYDSDPDAADELHPKS